MKWFAWLVVLTLLSVPAQAANISLWENPNQNDINILIKGDIEYKDDEIFEKHLQDAKQRRGSRRIVVDLKSRGGNFASGIIIAEDIHDNKLTTWVSKDEICASVCGIMWLAGYERFATSTSQIGFHAVYDGKTGHDVGLGNALLGSILTKWGYQIDVIAYVTELGADSMNFLTVETAQEHHIKYSGELPSSHRKGVRIAELPTQPEPEPEPPSPEVSNGGVWASFVGDNACILKTRFQDGRFIGLGVTTEGVFALVSKPSWSIPTHMQVGARVWIDNYPPLSGPGYVVPGVPTAMGIRVHPQYYRPLVRQMFDGWWAWVQFTGNEQPWRVSLWGVQANWPRFAQCASRVYPPFIHNSTQPW